MAAGARTDTPDEQLEGAAWDLEQLVDGEGEEGARRLLTEALERSRAFAERYSGRLDELDSDGLAEAMRELAEIQELAARGGYYAALAFSTNTADPQRGALLAQSRSGRRRSRPRCCSSSCSGRRSATSAPSSCWPARAWTSAATTCATSAATAPTC